MTGRTLIFLAALPLLAQPSSSNARLLPLDNHPGWYAVDGRVTPLVGAVADPALLQWPDQRVRDLLDLIVRSGGNLLVASPPAALTPPESTQPDPWLRFQRLLEWSSQRRIILSLQIDACPEPVQAKIRETAAPFGHVIFAKPGASDIVQAASVEAFWRALLNGASKVAFTNWNQEARASVRAARMISSFTPIWEYAPHDELLLDRTSAPAYASARGELSYLVYMPKGGSVSIAASEAPHAIIWISLDTAEVEGHARPTAGGIIPLAAPDSRHWLALVSR